MGGAGEPVAPAGDHRVHGARWSTDARPAGTVGLVSVTRPSVVVGVDGSEHGDRVLAAAAALAGLAGHRLVVVHVAHPPAMAAAAPTMGALAASAEELADHCHMYCEVVLATTSVAWSFEFRHGDAAAELLRAGTDHEAVCIVVGRNSHRRITRLVLGSITNRLVLQADRPVLVVPPGPWWPSPTEPPPGGRAR
jgi:nucleotide-binding universal stress UspA family protein